ncbi:hypothetical protein, unlikely [Trypanosoma brucei gambiense DAL972]|uniref:Uncharacterized protein n=1 Tax=Trypanosoma brucei gambiense (strain MHOM/CI/86/DAL972) TaxID=679716 RepID=C9ZU78_TRYB9|nr:hypothetical protein, unlikely [Trypanosoma brucei gambiense DAL972]CBH12964.1 hypothetical protein, unlikely [Trypanosoma brucei gambiense DAL972]|eukprot:XP_011775243.1 hypothetical protein, unlikely [Trypanosoma brucei gambiense DAL972]
MKTSLLIQFNGISSFLVVFFVFPQRNMCFVTRARTKRRVKKKNIRGGESGRHTRSKREREGKRVSFVWRTVCIPPLTLQKTVKHKPKGDTHEGGLYYHNVFR